MDIITPPKKNLVFDATVFTSVMTCATFVDLRFNHNFEKVGGKSNNLETGSIAHKVMEYYYKSKIKGFNREVSIANGLVAGEMYVRGCMHCTEFVGTDTNPKPVCGHEPNEFPGVKNTPAESDSRIIGWQYVLKTCEEYFDYYKNDFWVPLFVEEVKRKVLYEDDDIRIMWKAKLDLGVDTNQGIYSVDHKTMKQRRDTVELNNQFIGQCHVMGTRSVIINKIGFQSSLKPNEKFTRPMISYTADKLIEWQSEILPYWAYQYLSYVESGVWPPNYTHCESKYGQCPFYEVCKSDRGMRESVLKNEYTIIPAWDVMNMDSGD